MKTATETPTTKRPSRVFILAERWILSLTMTVLALVVERRLIRAIKRAA
jgi:hypothetical protein